MSESLLSGKGVILRPATLDDRRAIFEWSALSDSSSSMMGPPLFPDAPLPTWEEFLNDYLPYYFDGSAPELGRCYVIEVDGEPVGTVSSNDIQERNGQRRVELDIWMRAERYCGRGYGSDALLTLCQYLAREQHVQVFMVQPSARNPRAIRAYEKIGFKRLPQSFEEARADWVGSDYDDSIFMVLTIP